MIDKLSTIVQQANNVGTGRAQDKQIFINREGEVSGKSGLSFFKRNFSSSAKAAENRATLQAFHDAIAESPEYGHLLEEEHVMRFFQTKHAEGSPLSAKEVLQLKRDMEALYLIRGKVMDKTEVAYFFKVHAGREMGLQSPDSVKNALKPHFQDHFTNKVDAMLETAGGNRVLQGWTVRQILQACPAWDTAVEKAFEGDLSSLSQDEILDRFGSALEDAVGLLGGFARAFESAPLTLSFLVRACHHDDRNLPLIDGAVAAVRDKTLSVEEGIEFLKKWHLSPENFSTPDQLRTAIIEYSAAARAENMFMRLAAGSGLPEQAGKTLAHNPEYEVRLRTALSAKFPPDSSPTREAIDAVARETAAKYLEEKKDTVTGLLRLTETSKDFPPVFAEKAGQLDENGICRMLNALLAGRELLDKLLDPASGPDAGLVERLKNFQAALLSGVAVAEGPFNPETEGEKCLAALMGARGEPDAQVILKAVSEKLPVVSGGLASMEEAIHARRLTVATPGATLAAIGRARDAARGLAGLAHSAATASQRQALNVPDDQRAFVRGLAAGADGKTPPLESVHQSVRSFGFSLGVEMERTPYTETHALAESEAMAFTGGVEQPEATDLLRQTVAEVARELGLESFDPATLDPAAVRMGINAALRSMDTILLTPAQARNIAGQVIRGLMTEPRSALGVVAGLRLAAGAKPGRSEVTPAGKNILLRFVYGSSVRDPNVVLSVMSKAQTLVTSLQNLTVPGLTAENLTGIILKTASDLGMTSEDGMKDADATAFALALDMLALTPEQKADVASLLSGEAGIATRECLRYLDALVAAPGTEAQRVIARKLSGASVVLKALDSFAGTGGTHTAAPGAPIGILDVSPAALTAANLALSLESEFPVEISLALLSPRPTPEEWKTLAPMMEMIAGGFPGLQAEAQAVRKPAVQNRRLAVKTAAANAPELLAAQAAQGRALTPGEIWQTIMGTAAPQGITPDNLGFELFRAARTMVVNTVLEYYPGLERYVPEGRSLVQFFNDIPFMEGLCTDCLGRGVPVQALCAAYRPGGKLDLSTTRQGAPVLSSLANYTPENAYGLVTDWSRREADSSGRPSVMTIRANNGDKLLSLPHIALTDKENKADNPIFTEILATCRNVCRSELQFQRVMQSLSQASTALVRMLTESSLPGLGLSEHGFFDSTVSPQPDGSVIVDLNKGENERPFGARIQVTVTPDGEATVTDISVVMRG